ncbi:MAG: VOC family protein [Terriglobales bacterium]
MNSEPKASAPLPGGGDFALGSIGQIGVPAQNVARAAVFYGGRLRLPLLYADEGMAFFQAGDVRVLLYQCETPPATAAQPLLYFTVSGIRAAYQALIERGVRFPSPPQRISRLEQGELWMAFFRDSEGNALAIMSEEPAAEG